MKNNVQTNVPVCYHASLFRLLVIHVIDIRVHKENVSDTGV